MFLSIIDSATPSLEIQKPAAYMEIRMAEMCIRDSITGFKTVFTTVINSYARELGVLKDKDVNFTGADVRNGKMCIRDRYTCPS